MSSQLLKRLAGPALILGGLLWISIYVFTVIGGLITGKLVWLTSAHQPLLAHMLPRPIAWILIVISIVTLPILLLTPLPIGPDWATDTLAFLLSGIGYAVVGATLIMAYTLLLG